MRSIAATVVFVLALSACAAPLGSSRRQDASLEPQPQALAYEPMVVVPLPVPLSAQVRGNPLAALSARATPVQDLLLTLFKDGNVNLVVDPTVTGTATFDIKGTTVEHAFEVMMQSLDLAYRYEGDFLIVAPRERRIFDVDLLANAISAASGTSGASGASGGDGGEVVDVWAALTTDLQEILGERGTAVLNPTAGTVHVDATPQGVARVRDYLGHLFERLTAQVSLEARVLEVRLDDEFRLGVNWALLPGFFNTNEAGTLPGGAILGQTAASGGTAMNFGLLKAGSFSAFVDALGSQGQVRVLSSPRVSTMNNRTATIAVTDQIPVIEREIIDSQGGLRTQFDIRFVEAGISIAVTPQIGKDGMITISVTPTVTEQTGTVVTPDGLQNEPILSTRTTTTTVRVPDGQAVVVGGLRSTRSSETLNGIPFLSSIPLLGQLFRSTVQQRQDVELMVMVAPRRLDATWLAEERRRGMERLLGIRRPFQFGSIRLGDETQDWGTGFLAGARSAGDRDGLRTEAEVPPAAAAPASASISRAGLADRLIRRAVAEVEAAQTAHAFDLLRQALALAPDRNDARIYAGILAARDGDADAGRRWLDAAIAAGTTDAHALLARGAVELAAGAPQAARRWFDAAFVKQADATIGNALAAALATAGEFERARTVLERFEGVAGASPELHANLCHVRTRLGDFAGAQTALAKALELGVDPADPRVESLRQELAAAERAALPPGK